MAGIDFVWYHPQRQPEERGNGLSMKNGVRHSENRVRVLINMRVYMCFTYIVYVFNHYMTSYS